jgi:hypothetical protein
MAGSGGGGFGGGYSPARGVPLPKKTDAEAIEQPFGTDSRYRLSEERVNFSSYLDYLNIRPITRLKSGFFNVYSC